MFMFDLWFNLNTMCTHTPVFLCFISFCICFIPCILIGEYSCLKVDRSTIQARILILLNSNLYPMLYAGNCLMGVILA